MLLSRRAAVNAMVAGGVGTAIGAGSYGVSYSRHQLQLVHAPLPVLHLPNALDGLRIALITDLHHSEMVPLQDVERAVTLAMSEHPDLIVLGGDYVTWGDSSYVVPCSEGLARLSAPLGVYAVLGNHDDEHDTSAALASNGFTVLRDARTTITARGEQFDLAGIRFWTQRRRDVARVVRGAAGAVVLIAHDPRRLNDASDLDVGAVLSGHTHGGQVNLPIFGPVAARKFPVVAGSAQRNKTSIFVSRGVGTVYVPFRFNCPPDVAILTLTPRLQTTA